MRFTTAAKKQNWEIGYNLKQSTRDDCDQKHVRCLGRWTLLAGL